MNRIKNFFIGTFLSGVCLMFSAPVLAGNGQSGSQAAVQTTVNNICIRLGFIERKILFETTTQLLNELNLIFVVLKTMETKMSFDQKNLVLEQFINILYKQELSDRLKISSGADKELYKNLSENVVSMKMPLTPKIGPKKFIGEIDDWVWWSSVGTEDMRGFGF